MLRIVYLVMLLIMTSCQNSWMNSSISEMSDEEMKYEKKVLSKSLLIMPLEKMFENLKVRELLKAVVSNDFSKADELILQGIDINQKGFRGISLLMWPLRENNLSAFEYLLKKGVDPDNVFDGGSDDQQLLTLIVWHYDVGFLELLLEYGANPNIETGYSKSTPIQENLLGGDTIERVKLLLKYGAEINHKSSFNQTVLHTSLDALDYKLAIMLLENGADLNIVDTRGRTGLSMIKERKGHFDQDKELRKFKAPYDELVEWLLINKNIEIK